VGPVVAGLDVGGDRRPGVIEGLELRAPDEALLELGEPGLDEGLGLGIAVALTPVFAGQARRPPSSSLSRQE